MTQSDTDDSKSSVAPLPPATQGKVTMVTKEGLEKLKAEMEYLKNVKRKEIAERLKEAISYGDLSENSEYEDAKNEQALVEGRIAELEEKIKYAQIIEETKTSAHTVQLGSRVSVKRLGKGKGIEEFLMVGSTEWTPSENQISNMSPVGRALLGRRVGETVHINAPSGKSEFEIVSIE